MKAILFVFLLSLTNSALAMGEKVAINDSWECGEAWPLLEFGFLNQEGKRDKAHGHLWKHVVRRCDVVSKEITVYRVWGRYLVKGQVWAVYEHKIDGVSMFVLVENE